MNLISYPGGVWIVKFLASQREEGDLPQPLIMVALEIHSRRMVRLMHSALLEQRCAPFKADSQSLVIGFKATVELGCFLELGWQMPTNVLDLYVEFRNKTNGMLLQMGDGLIGALAFHGLDTHCVQHSGFKRYKENFGQHDVISKQELQAAQDRCELQVLAMEKLLSVMEKDLDAPRALLRGSYVVAVAHMEKNGVPIDVEAFQALRSDWQKITGNLIKRIDANYGVYDGTYFSPDRFNQYLKRYSIEWPRRADGQPDFEDEIFRRMSRLHPKLARLRELRSTLEYMRPNKLCVGADGRNRCQLRMFASRTGRNQPSTSKFIFGPPVWLRSLIKPSCDYGLGYVDWSQQEFGIAAGLSRDKLMMEAYRSGDPYLAFARQSGELLQSASKSFSNAVRAQFKEAVLAVQYGMGAEGFAQTTNQPIARARQLLQLHKQNYHRFWQWLDSVLNQALLGGRLWTAFGWQLQTHGHMNAGSICNFPMQANGAEMLRLACTRLIQDGVRVCASVHDAILIEAPQNELLDAVAHTQKVMAEASAMVLRGFHLRTDAKLFRSAERFVDGRGVAMWNSVMEELKLSDRKIEL